MQNSVRHITSDELLEYLDEQLCTDGRLTVDTDLVAAGALDSMLVMAVTAHLERRYGVSIAPEEISPQNFRTVGALYQLIASKQTSGHCHLTPVPTAQ